MSPISDASAGTTGAVQPPTAPSGPPQRQSCDRCHKQKLRCIRNKNTNSGVCDRCLSKRAQCVYSLSLPKGRPSLHRPLNDETNTGNHIKSGDKEGTSESIRSGPKSRPLSAASKPTQPIATSGEVAPTVPGTMAPSILPQSMDTTSMDMGMLSWPSMETTTWNEPHPELGWGHDLTFGHSNVDDLLTSINNFPGERNVQEAADSFLPTPPSPNSSHLRTFSQSQPGIGNYDRQNSIVMDNMDFNMSGTTMNMFPTKSSSEVISELSQLSVHLSALRSSSHDLAQAAELSTSPMSTNQTSPLIDPASFGSVAAWLAHEQCSGKMNVPLQLPPEFQNAYPSPSPESQVKAQGCQGGPNILRNVFCASHRLMEIIRNLQADDIIRHLIMACEALLLEIYLAILTVLQHEAYPGHHMSGTALGNVRLVLVVQLCAYLIERQQQAVEQCLTPATTPISNLSNSSLSPGPFRMTQQTDRESLKELKIQVQQKLTHLRQILRCS